MTTLRQSPTTWAGAVDDDADDDDAGNDDDDGDDDGHDHDDDDADDDDDDDCLDFGAFDPTSPAAKVPPGFRDP